MSTQPSTDNMSPATRAAFMKLSPEDQTTFRAEMTDRRKETWIAYVLLIFIGAHYAYLKKWGVQVAFWLTLGGVGIWWLIDLFRTYGLINDWNIRAEQETLMLIGAANASDAAR